MAITLSTGATLAIAKTYGNAITMSALSNATEAVASLTDASSISANDYLEVTSGWGLLDKRVVRVKSKSTNDVVLESIDTTNTTKYPASSGTGSVRKITAWENLSQVKSLSASGGELQFADTTSIDDVVAKQQPTIRSAVSMTIDCYDDPTLAWWDEVVTASDARTPYGFRMSLPNGSKMVANAYWSMNKVPTTETNQALVTQITLSFAAEPVRYST
jgi:hypothetical protein